MKSPNPQGDLGSEASTSALDAAGAKFPVTRWSVIAKLHLTDSAAAREALVKLCELYWRPIYAFLRRSNFSTHDAEDHAQSFFQSILTQEVFSRADPERGRLRSFLLSSLKLYLANARRAEQRIKRGGGRVVIPLDALDGEQWMERELVNYDTPEQAFDRGWVMALLQRVLEALENEYARAGKSSVFAALRPFLLEGAAEPGAYHDPATRLGLTEQALRVQVHRLRMRYREMLIREVADTVSGPEQLGGELGHLLIAARQPV